MQGAAARGAMGAGGIAAAAVPVESPWEGMWRQGAAEQRRQGRTLAPGVTSRLARLPDARTAAAVLRPGLMQACLVGMHQPMCASHHADVLHLLGLAAAQVCHAGVLYHVLPCAEVSWQHRLFLCWPMELR